MTKFTDDQLRYHAKKGGFPQRELAEELLRVRALVGKFREEATRLEADRDMFGHKVAATEVRWCADELEQAQKEENDG